MNSQTREKIRTLKGHENKILALTQRKNEKNILSGCHDFTIKLWNFNSGVLKKTLYNIFPRVLITTKEGKILISSMRKIINLWNLRNYKLIRNALGHM